MSDEPKAKADRELGAAVPRLRPTIIPPPPEARRTRIPKDLPPAPAQTAHRPVRPTVIPGVPRERIGVTPTALARLSPDAAPRVAKRALALINAFVVEDARDDHAARWGEEALRRHVDLAAVAIDLAESPALDHARDLVAEVGAGLRAIEIDARRGLSLARGALDRQVGEAQAALPPLVAQHDALEDHIRQWDETLLEIEASALAALFLSEHLAPDWPGLARRFLQREIVLTETALDIRGGAFERVSRLDEARALIVAIQDGVLTALPDWLDRARAAGGRPTPTQAGDLQARLRVLLRKLQA